MKNVQVISIEKEVINNFINKGVKITIKFNYNNIYHEMFLGENNKGKAVYGAIYTCPTPNLLEPCLGKEYHTLLRDIKAAYNNNSLK